MDGGPKVVSRSSAADFDVSPTVADGSHLPTITDDPLGRQLHDVYRTTISPRRPWPCWLTLDGGSAWIASQRPLQAGNTSDMQLENLLCRFSSSRVTICLSLCSSGAKILKIFTKCLLSNGTSLVFLLFDLVTIANFVFRDLPFHFKYKSLKWW